MLGKVTSARMTHHLITLLQQTLKSMVDRFKLPLSLWLDYGKWAKRRAMTTATKGPLLVPIAWPMLIGSSLYVGLGETTLPFPLPDGYG